MTNLSLLEKALWTVQNVFNDNESFLQKFVDKHYPIVSVDQSSCLGYGMNVELFCPELENIESEEFDVRYLNFFHLQGQTADSSVSSQDVFNELQKNGLLTYCLGIRELMAIRDRGVEFFQEYFKGKYLLGWKSALRFRKNGPLLIPVLWKEGEKLIIDFEEISNINVLDTNCSTRYLKAA